ncbi:MAG: hypothetical protein CMO61_02725 [Verrucomicrobiales bacterium]|jgi:hypothetical protein|nr:hypothetical protein [Verrucomicrobiales bacterium]|tara:strand:+ start:13108 stop:13410 length:303 start_codon:yes stop_codon:yes gene_type:complete
MKLLLLIALTSLLSGSSLLANTPPALSATMAAQIAQDDLSSRGLEEEIYIWQMTYKKDSLVNEEAYWEVLWNKAFKAQTKGRKEYGLRIRMTGDYRRAVK